MNVRYKVQVRVDTQMGRKLLRGTSRTKYCGPKDFEATVHSYRDAKLADLFATISRFPWQILNCVTIVAGFNENSSTVSDFANFWRFYNAPPKNLQKGPTPPTDHHALITTQEEIPPATTETFVLPNATQSNPSSSAKITVTYDTWNFIDKEVKIKLNDIYKNSLTGNRA